MCCFTCVGLGSFRFFLVCLFALCLFVCLFVCFVSLFVCSFVRLLFLSLFPVPCSMFVSGVVVVAVFMFIFCIVILCFFFNFHTMSIFICTTIYVNPAGSHMIMGVYLRYHRCIITDGGRVVTVSHWLVPCLQLPP